MIGKYFCRDVAISATPFVLKCGPAVAIGVAVVGAVASIVGSSITNAQNASNVASTNATNAQSVKETNEANERIAKESNETSIQLQREMNEYNSIGSQLQRGREAGVNPNTILGGSVSGNLQTSTAPLTSPVMQAFQALQFMKQNPTAELADNLQKVAGIIPGIKESYSRSRQNELLGDYQSIVNKYESQFKELGLDVNKAQLNQYVANASLAWQQMRNAKIDAQRIQALVSSVDLDNYDKTMRNIFSKDFYEQSVKSAMSICKVNETQARLMVERFPFDIGLVKSQISSNYSSAHYMREMATLAPVQRKVLEAQEGFINSQTFGNWLDNNFKQDLQPIIESESRARAKREWQGYSNDVWHNTDLYRFSEWFGQMTDAVGSAVGSYVGARTGMKSVGKGSSVGNPVLDVDKFNSYINW